MHAHIIRGRTSRGDDAAGHWRRWLAEVAPGASGWVDVAGGTTPDGELVAVTRFASDLDARRTLEGAAHRRWWEEALARLDGEPTVWHSGDITAMPVAVDPEAGFVQMMLAEVAHRPTVERIEEEIGEAFQRWRPDLLGGYRVWLPDGRLLAVDFFTSEAQARAGEQREPPPEVAEAMPRWMAQLSDVAWFDLADPWVAVRTGEAISG